MQETQVQSLGQEDPLEKEMATYSSILARKIPWTEEPGGLQSMGLQRVRLNWVTIYFMAALTICSDFGAQENKVCLCFYFSPSVHHEVMGPDAMILVFWMLSFKPGFFTLLFHPHQEFLLAFCHKGGVICISEVVDISPGNLDSSLCFI